MTSEIYWTFAIMTSVATLAAVAIYRVINKHPCPMSTRIGAAFGGAAVGTFTGALTCTAYSIEGWFANVITLVVATGIALALQRNLFHWTINRGPLSTNKEEP